MKPLLLRTLFLAIGIGSLCFHSTTASAQATQKPDKHYALSDTIALTIFDYAQYRAYYQKEYRDVPSDPKSYRWLQLLQIGSKYQGYVNYGELRADSIWNASIKAGKSDAEFDAEWTTARRESQPDVKLLFDRNKGVLDAYDRVFVSKYHYREPIPQQQWTMAEGDSTILGYTCHKATTRFRGRDYIAWYTEEIPFPYGPFKFGGLPGLITCIYDTKREHIYTLVGFEKAPSEDYIYEEARRMWWFETKREVVAKLQRNYHEQPDLFTSDIVVRDPKSKPVKHHSKPYNPIELE